MLASRPRLRHVFGLAAVMVAAGMASAEAAEDDAGALPDFPTTEFAEGASTASVTSEGVTARVSLERRPEIDPSEDVPVLHVLVDGKPVLTVPGVPSGFDFPATEASIAEIDPDNHHPEVYFTSYSGGAHCCNAVVVAEELGDHWVAVPIGDFDGDGNYLNDLDGNGIAEIATVDNSFLYRFDCYACSAAPLVVTTVRGGKAIDVSREPRYLPAHREWLRQLEANVDGQERWTSPGFLAGWVAAKIRVGEGAQAWAALNARWNKAKDPGEATCLTGGDIDACAKSKVAVLKFPERLKLFLEQSGHRF